MGRSAWADCSGRKHLAEVQGSLGQEEDHREAFRSQEVEAQSHPYHRNQEQHRDYQGNHEVHQDLGNEPVAGIAAAAGQEGSRREGRAAAVGQADHGTEVAAGWEAAAVAEQGVLTTTSVSYSAYLNCISHAAKAMLQDDSVASVSLPPL